MKQSRCSGLWLCDIERMLQIFGRSSRLVGRNVQDAAGNPSTYQSRKPMAIANKILRVQLRSGALTNFDPARIKAAFPAAARSIGGLCSRMLRFGTGLSLEEVLVRHAVGLEVAGLEREGAAAGAMMIPIPAAGVLKAIHGEDAARAGPGIEDVVITMEPGRELVPLPEGASYLGFLFARGGAPAEVEAALRAAHRALRFEVTPLLPAR